VSEFCGKDVEFVFKNIESIHSVAAKLSPLPSCMSIDTAIQNPKALKKSKKARTAKDESLGNIWINANEAQPCKANESQEEITVRNRGNEGSQTYTESLLL
jgi:hypothetical protein